MNPSMNDGAGFRIDPFDIDPFVMMTYNPPECPRYAEAVGYRKVRELYAWLFEWDQELGEKIGRLVNRVCALRFYRLPHRYEALRRGASSGQEALQ